MTFGTSATERMRIDTSGNVGIGTSSGLSARLTISGVDAGAALDLNSTGTLGRKMRLVSANGAYGGLAFEDVTANALRMVIDSSGNLLVGKTSASDTVAGAGLFTSGGIGSSRASSSNSDVTYAVYSTTASAYRFYVGMGGTVYATNTTISSLSDQRFKENIIDLDVGLDKIMALKPRKFDWKEGKGKDIKGDRGFIAQEFEAVFPDLIDEWKDPAPNGEEPYKSVRADLIPILVKAIQEQQAIITDLKSRITALENK
jgi:hypothetical protein